ncbi:MAG: DUF4097 family beta strand repeat-containing protein [Gemmatimonadota bacterium]
MKSTIFWAAAGVLVMWPKMEMGTQGLTVPGNQVAERSTSMDDFSWHRKMAPGQTLEIKGVNGSITAVPADGDEAEVTATKRARRSDPDDVEIKVIETSDGVTICAVYPTPARSRQENECARGHDGHMNTENNDVTVTFTVKVPRGVRYEPRTVNGDVRAAGLKSDIVASTVNGGVRISTSGRAEATTVNGDIDASMGNADWGDDVSFTTVNGGITLDLPANVNAELRASTVNGDITSDFPVTVRGRFGPRKMSGTLGHGGHELELETVNGSIVLRKGE